MSQTPTFPFQPNEGPGPNFRQAPIPKVKDIVFQYENANTITNTQLLPSFSMAVNAPPQVNDMDFSYEDEQTMTKLTDLQLYLEQQPKFEEPSSDDDSSKSLESMDQGQEDSTNDVPMKLRQGPRNKYRSYHLDQWQSLLDTVTNRLGQISVSEASKLVGIKERTG